MEPNETWNETKAVNAINTGGRGDNNMKVDDQCDDMLEAAFRILYTVIGLVMFMGNSFTSIVFVSSSRLRQNSMNIFLLSLACWDVLMAVLVIPFYAIHCSLGCNYFLSEYCWLFRKFKDCVLMGATFNVCAITFDRFLAVLRPLRYVATMTKRRVTVILAGVWTLPAVVAGIRSSWHHTKKDKDLRYANKMYDTILVFVFVVVSVLVMLVVNVKIMKTIKRHNKREITENSRRKATRQNTSEIATRRKGTTSCLLVVFVFMVCWLPRIVYNFSYIIKPPGLASPLFFRLAFFSLFLQSSVNPFIYSFYRSEFRKATLKLIKWRSNNRVNPILLLSEQGKPVITLIDHVFTKHAIAQSS